MLKKLTPILFVESIETSLPFWRKLGFQTTAEVPHEDRIGFAILDRDELEVMLQTFASAIADVPDAVTSREPGSVTLYFETDDLESIERELGDAPIVVPKRTTDYGATEIFVREPSGHVVGFARHS